MIVRSTVHYLEPYQTLAYVLPVCTYPQMLQRSSDPDLLDSSKFPNLPTKDTASAFPDKNPSTAQSVFTYLITITSVSLCNSFNKPTCVCINPLSPVLNCDSMSVAFVEWIFVDSPTWSRFSVI